jgi:hypothetical protein
VKPPAYLYSCSAFETDATGSIIVGSAKIHSVATSSTFSGSWGASRSITPTPGKSMYRHVAISITSSRVMAPRAEELSATSVVGEGPGTSTAEEGSDNSTVGGGPAADTTSAGSDTGAIAASRPSDTGGGFGSSSKTTTASHLLRSASAGVSKAA